MYALSFAGIFEFESATHVNMRIAWAWFELWAYFGMVHRSALPSSLTALRSDIAPPGRAVKAFGRANVAQHPHCQIKQQILQMRANNRGIVRHKFERSAARFKRRLALTLFDTRPFFSVNGPLSAIFVGGFREG